MKWCPQDCETEARLSKRIADLEAALRLAIACIEHMRPMVMYDGIEGDQDDGDVAVTLLMLSEALKQE